jgi:hypothetical protein
MLSQLNNYRKTSLTKNRNTNGPSFSCRTLQPPLPWSLDAHENQSSVTHATVSTMPNRRPIADAIINLRASSQVSRHNNETFSESHQSSLDSSANSGLCVTTPNVSAAKPTNQGVFNEA